MYGLQAIEGEATETRSFIICHILSLLWALSDNVTCVRFYWVPRNFVIEWNVIVNQLANETLGHDIDPLATVHYAGLKPLVNSYAHQEFRIKWDVSTQGRDMCLLKPTLGPTKKLQR